MTIAYRSKNIKGNGSGTSVVHAAPSGLANNDILLFMLYKQNSAAVTYPAGFTEVAAIASGTSFWLYVAWKRASSESGTYTFSWTGSTWRYSMLGAYSGCITSGSPMDATPTTLATASETNVITCPSITTATANALVIPFGADYNLDVTGATLSGYTVREDVLPILVSDAIKAAAGATGTLAYSRTGTDRTGGVTIALKDNVVTISPSAITSAEAVGSLSAILNAVASGIASAAAVGTPVASLNVSPTGIASAAAVGTPVAGLNVSAAGIASGAAVGAAVASLNVSAAGIASGAAFGTPTIGVDLTIYAQGIASAEVVGTPSASLNVSATGIASGAAVGTPSASLNVSASGIASAAAVGTPVASLNISAAGIASAEAFGTPTVGVDQTIYAQGIASAEAFGTPAIYQNVSAVGIASAEAIGSQSVSLDVSVSGIYSAETVSEPAVYLFVSTVGISSAEAFGFPAVGEYAISIQAIGIPSAESFGLAVVDSFLRWVQMASAVRSSVSVATETTGALSATVRAVEIPSVVSSVTTLDSSFSPVTDETNISVEVVP
jgi:hypothetical protein